jgi:hypothetical protein
MLWLRWRLSRNQWRRDGGLAAAISAAAVGLGFLLALAGGAAGVAVGLAFPDAWSPRVTLAVWDVLAGVFLFFWMTGLVSELQRAEMIDLRRLLHLPVSIPDAFVLNYLASLLSFSLALMLPAMLGLAVGQAAGGRTGAWLLPLLVVSFFFMVTAWTLCLRGWLASVMVDKRRRRTVVMAVTMVFILLFQLPNLLTPAPRHKGTLKDGQGDTARHRGEAVQSTGGTATTPAASHGRGPAADPGLSVVLVHAGLPLLWLPHGARELSRGAVWPAAWCALGMGAIGLLGLTRAYRTTLRFYLGSGSGARTAAAPRPRERTSAPPDGRVLLVERTLGPIPDGAAAVACATLRSMLRAPEVKMALVTNAAVFGILAVSVLLRRSAAAPVPFAPFLGSMAVGMTFFGMTNLMFNQFGFDRDGFRLLVLLPTPRKETLLGKNLALLPATAAVFAVMFGLMTFFAPVDAVTVMASILDFGAAFLGLSALGNVMSILAPHRVAAGSVRPTKAKSTTGLVHVAVALLFPLAVAPFLGPATLAWLIDRHTPFAYEPALLIGSAALALLCGAIYAMTLAPLGDLLERRERRILEIVTREIE